MSLLLWNPCQESGLLPPLDKPEPEQTAEEEKIFGLRIDSLLDFDY